MTLPGLLLRLVWFANNYNTQLMVIYFSLYCYAHSDISLYILVSYRLSYNICRVSVE